MTHDHEDRIRSAFQKTTHVLVRVTTKGFGIDGNVVPEITGRIVKRTLLRKLFEDGALTCESQDGITGQGGLRCDDCRHPRCRPILRVHLQQQSVVFVVDLAVSSARNLLDHEQRHPGQALLRLSVRDHGHWGEVLFDTA